MSFKKVIVYGRPWNAAQLRDIASKVAVGSNLRVLSEHRKVDECGISEAFYLELSRCKDGGEPRKVDLDFNDIILRCRVLRSLDRDNALLLVAAMSFAIEKAMREYKPQLVISQAVDSYVIHILYLHCQRQGVPFVGLIGSFVNGYFRVTALGERNDSRLVDGQEVSVVSRRLLDSQYKPSFLVNSRDLLFQRAKKSWLRNIVKPLWFGVLARLTGDIYNYHYQASIVVSRQHRTLLPQIYKGLVTMDRSTLVSLAGARKVIFMPLQMSPEATVDYWSSNADWVDYEKKVLETLDRYADVALFVVKEHPNVLGNRSSGFYRRLALRKNCLMIDASCNSNELVNMCDGVLICTGTVGFESRIRGKSIYSDSSPFHLMPADVNGIESLRFEVDDRGEVLVEDRVRYLLEGLLPGYFINDGTWDANDQKHQLANSEVANSIVGYLNFCGGYK